MASLTYANIETRVMNQLRIPTTNATEQTKIAALINEVYRDIYSKHDWWWLLKRQIVNTVNNFKTGTISVTNNTSSGITITTTATIPALAFFRLLPTGDTIDTNATYLVSSSHAAAGTVITLDSLYTGVTSTASSFLMSRDTYDLASDTGKVLHVRRYGREIPLKRVGMEEMSRVKLFDRTSNKPEMYTVWDFSVTGDPTTVKQLVVHPYPDQTYRLEIWYKQTLNTELSGATRPLIPDDYVQLLVYGALARGYPIWLNDLERGKFFQSLFNDLLALMTNAQREYATDKAGFAPDDTYRGMQSRRRRAATGFTLGGFFDRFPSQP